MSDPNQFQAPPPPAAGAARTAAASQLRPVAIGLFIVGLIAVVTGIAKILGRHSYGAAFAFWDLARRVELYSAP
jgi:hypothetical protein